jgi:hypothetical protein
VLQDLAIVGAVRGQPLGAVLSHPDTMSITVPLDHEEAVAAGNCVIGMHHGGK